MIKKLLILSLGIMPVYFASDIPFKFSFELEDMGQYELVDLNTLSKRKVDKDSCDGIYSVIDNSMEFPSEQELRKCETGADLAWMYVNALSYERYWDFNYIITKGLFQLYKKELYHEDLYGEEIEFFNAFHINTCRYDLMVDFYSKDGDISGYKLKAMLTLIYHMNIRDDRLYELMHKYINDDNDRCTDPFFLSTLSNSSVDISNVSKSIIDAIYDIDDVLYIHFKTDCSFYYLAQLYNNSDFDYYNEQLAINLFKIAAQDDNIPQAQYQLGQLYESGELLSQATDSSLRWYLQSAANGYVPAIRKLAEFYTNSNDLKLAEKFHIEAAIQSNGKDINALIAFYNQHPTERSVDEIAKWSLRKEGQCLERAQQGDPIDQYFMAYHLASQTSESSKIKYQIINWLEKSAMQGFTPAQRALYATAITGYSYSPDFHDVVMYVLQKDLDVNICESFWQKKSIEMKAFTDPRLCKTTMEKLIPLMMQMDFNYLINKGIFGDVVDKYPCKYLKVADVSKFLTQYVIADDYDGLSISERLKKSTNHQISCFLEKTKKSAESGDILSMYAYARMISEQKDDMPTIKEALKWYRKAGEYGHNRAMFEISVLLDEYPELREDNETCEQYRSQYVNPRRFKGNDRYE